MRKGEILAKVTGENQCPYEKSHGGFKWRLKHGLDLKYQCWLLSEIMLGTF